MPLTFIFSTLYIKPSKVLDSCGKDLHGVAAGSSLPSLMGSWASPPVTEPCVMNPASLPSSSGAALVAASAPSVSRSGGITGGGSKSGS